MPTYSSGLSAGGVLKPDMVKRMAAKAIDSGAGQPNAGNLCRRK